MNLLRLLPVIVSLVLLAAHFYRAELPVLVGLCAFLPLLLFLRRPWVPQLFQGILVLGALEWLRTLYMLAAMRTGFDQPWGRLAVILGAVALFARSRHWYSMADPCGFAIGGHGSEGPTGPGGRKGFPISRLLAVPGISGRYRDRGASGSSRRPR